MMKKAIKKLMAAALAIAMLCVMAVPAFAAGDATYTITITNPVGTYEAYQIFAGTLSEDGVLSNITWGSGVTADGQTALGVASTVAKGLETEADAKAFAVSVSQYLGTAAGSGTNKITGLAPGYYLVKNSAVGDNEAYTSFILKVVKDVDVTPKSDKPSLEKKVQDINDTTGNKTDWQDSADYDIGDDVPFQLTTKVPTNFADYTSYKFVFHDVQSEGLTFKDDTVTVKIGDVQLAANQFSVVTDTDDNCTFHVVIPDLKKIDGIKAEDKVVVQYKSTLNDNAKIGAEGNPNEAHLEYSNNPYDSNDTTTTPNDKVTVFTYKVTVNKVDGDNKELKGAAFALYKKIRNGENDDWKLVELNNATEDNGVYTIVDANKTTFEWEGLDDGVYKIVEVITPAGYNTIADQEFTITASHDANSNDPKLTDLSGNADDGSITFTAKTTDGSLTTNVVNQKGATLPSTGGIGTTIFYVVGGCLMVAAVVLLVTKKRMENK